MECQRCADGAGWFLYHLPAGRAGRRGGLHPAPGGAFPGSASPLDDLRGGGERRRHRKSRGAAQRQSARPAFDVQDVGRMAVVQDPAGAKFCVWQAKKNKGTGIAGVDGTLCWADLSTPDPAAAGKFYSGLFGWKVIEDKDDDPPSGYLHIVNGDDFIGGIPPAAHRNPNAPPHWLAYFLVSSCDASTAKAKQLGAKAYMEPMTMEGVGRWAVLADPQGATFAVFQAMAKK